MMDNFNRKEPKEKTVKVAKCLALWHIVVKKSTLYTTNKPKAI